MRAGSFIDCRSALEAGAARFGRGAWLAFVVSVVALSGCRTHLSLRDNTVRATGTLADLNYQQVLDNLARFHDNPAAMPSYVNESLLSACRANTAYSHQSNWQGPTGFNAAYMMVSVDSLAAAEAAWQRGERTFRVVGSLADMVKGQEAPCPASAEMRAKLGKHIQCVDCMLCGGQKVDAKSMVIPVHGAGRKHHTAAAG